MLASPIYNKPKLALAAGHKAGFEVMHRGLGAGREQGFEQLSLEVRTTALNDFSVSHGFSIKPTPTRRERNGCAGTVCRIRTTHATLKPDDISGFRFGDQVGIRDFCAPLKAAQYAYRANKTKSFGAILMICL